MKDERQDSKRSSYTIPGINKFQAGHTMKNKRRIIAQVLLLFGSTSSKGSDVKEIKQMFIGIQHTLFLGFKNRASFPHNIIFQYFHLDILKKVKYPQDYLVQVYPKIN